MPSCCRSRARVTAPSVTFCFGHARPQSSVCSVMNAHDLFTDCKIRFYTPILFLYQFSSGCCNCLQRQRILNVVNISGWKTHLQFSLRHLANIIDLDFWILPHTRLRLCTSAFFYRSVCGIASLLCIVV